MPPAAPWVSRWTNSAFRIQAAPRGSISARSYSSSEPHAFLRVRSMNWTPAIADPTFVGWFAVFAYFSTAILCAFVAARSALRGTAKGRAWWILALVLVVLGVNKQWDLQGFVLEWSRSFASKHGVYEKRRIVQMAYLLLLAIIAMTAILLWIWMNRHDWREHGYMMASSIFLVTFVLVRAASFHYFQDFRLSGGGCSTPPSH